MLFGIQALSLSLSHPLMYTFGGMSMILDLLFFTLFCVCLFTTNGSRLDYLAGKMISTGKQDLEFCFTKGNTQRQSYQFNVLTNNRFRVLFLVS